MRLAGVPLQTITAIHPPHPPNQNLKSKQTNVSTTPSPEISTSPFPLQSPAASPPH
ncbi:hypothetical protein PSP6_260014 [Paraburkholderia tropica]|nr:hypothetical protein PSP6_260014 [Paraburkholderia tropica]